MATTRKNTTRKATTKAAEKQPEDTQEQSAEVPGAATSQPGDGENEQSSVAGVGAKDSDNSSTEAQEPAAVPNAPEAGAAGGDVESKERGPAKDGTSSEDVELEVVTRLERRIRAGVVVTKNPQVVRVSVEAAEALAADPHISVKRA